MKKILVLSLLCLCAVEAKAEKGVYLSSVSAVSGYRVNLCAGKRGFLKRVCVVDGVASSTAAVYNSWTVPGASVTLTGVIDASETGKGCYDFDVAASTGLMREQGGTASINVIYECY